MDIKKESKGIIRDTYNNFIYNYKSMIYFEVLYKLLAIFIFIPINYLILKHFMNKIGLHNITNTDLLKLGLTPQGITYIACIVFVSFIAIFVEIGILTYMANKSHKQEKASLWEAAINLSKMLPHTFSIYMIFLIFLAGVIGPLTGIGLYSSLIRRLTIPAFITLELNKSVAGTVLLWGFYIIIIILLLRWILSIPVFVIEDSKLKYAFKNSKKIFKTSRLRIFGYIIAWVIVYFFIEAIIGLIILLVGSFIISALEVWSSILAFLATCIFILIFFMAYIISLIVTLPLFISFLVELYYKFRNYKPAERTFKELDSYKESRILRYFKKHEKLAVFVIGLIFCINIGALGVSAVINRVIDKDIQVTAHRGSSLKSPENSISAIKKAIEENADYAEIDVMTTRDNKVVLFHDSTLKRIDGTNRSIANMTLDEVKEVDNGSYFSKDFKNERVPELEEVLKLAKGKIKLNIELKPMKKDDPLPKIVSDLVSKYEMEYDVVVSSLDYDSIQSVNEYNPLIKVGYILTIGVGDFTKFNVDFISVEYEMLRKELIYAMHVLNKEVHVWTINDEERVEDVIRLGVDNIITDDVELVIATNRELKEKGIPDYLTWFYESINSIIKYVKI